MEETLYTLYKDEETRCWESQVLKPGRQKAETLRWGYDSKEEMGDAIKETYENTRLISQRMLQREIENRTTHSPEMLALLSDTYAGDLRECHVYASILRPMTGIRIDGATFLTAPNGARYDDHWTIYTYVVAPGPLDKTIIDHYDLVFISHS